MRRPRRPPPRQRAPVVGRIVQRGLSTKSRIFLDAMMAAQQAETGKPPAPPGQPVEDHFAWLHRLTEGQDGAPAPLDGLIDILKDVYQDLSNLNFAGGVGNPQENSTALPRFQAAANRIEDGPIKRWASQITVGSSGITTEGNRAGINARWQETVLPIVRTGDDEHLSVLAPRPDRCRHDRIRGTLSARAARSTRSSTTTWPSWWTPAKAPGPSSPARVRTWASARRC